MTGQTDTPSAGTPGLARNGVEHPFSAADEATPAKTRSLASSSPGIDERSKQAPAVPEPGALAKVPLFRGLTNGQLSKLSTLLRCKRSSAGTEIITVKKPGEIAYVIFDGSVKIHIDQPDGSDVILAILGAGEIVGEMSLADSLGRSASVTTLEPSTLLMMDRATFWENLKEMPKITYNLVNVLSRRLRLANHAQSLVRLDVYGRVAGQLLAFAREYGEVAPNGDVLIPLRLTQSDLASMVGASRVRVNQALGFYKQRNYLSVNQERHIVVHDVDALGRHCS